jgi:uncharacterized protein YdaL
MKKLALILTIFASLPAIAWQWQGGIREDFITEYAYGFGSDAPARVYRELSDRGVDEFNLHSRLQYHGDKASTVVSPRIKSNFRDYEIAANRIRLLEKKMVVKPYIFSNPALGIATIGNKIKPERLDIFIASYQQQMSQFYKISRDTEIAEFVIGAGTLHLLTNNHYATRFANMIKHARTALHPRTILSLEIESSEDEAAFSQALKNNEFKEVMLKNIAKVNFTIAASDFWSSKVELQKNLADKIVSHKMWLESNLGPKKMGLSRVWIPACDQIISQSVELICLGNKSNEDKTIARFNEVKKLLLKLEEQSLFVDSVEVMESGTDFEPDKVDLRFFYFNNQSSNPELRELPNRRELSVLAPLPMPASKADKLACVIHDKLDNGAQIDRLGSIHATMLHTLLGAFKRWDVDRFPINEWFEGRTNPCDVVFYLATNFSQELPKGFTHEALRVGQERKLVWMNYKFSFLTETARQLGQELPFEVPFILNSDTVPSPTNQDPGFFRFFDYKGETFEKIAQWNPATNTFAANPEIGWIQLTRPSDVTIHSLARHSKDKDRETPYIVSTSTNGGEIWYVADSPFSFTHYEDRYFIFTDLLWDIVEETPEYQGHKAMVRIEDVNPTQDLAALKWAVDYLRDTDTPVAFALIPFYGDAVGLTEPEFKPVFKPITKFPDFMGTLRYSRNRGVDIVLHGVAHMAGDIVSGYDGISGADYEFWLYPENTPLPFDSVDWVMNRFDMAESVFEELKIKTHVFEAPHYAASVLDYHLFARNFEWTWHRSIYFPFTLTSNSALPSDMRFGKCKDLSCREERRGYLRNIEVEADYADFGGQITPYIIYKDVYGQALIPETLGMIDFAFYSPATWRPVSTPKDVLRRAKKLKVVRGAMASFFWHPQLLEPRSRYYRENPGSWDEMGGKKSLTQVVEGLKDLGYEFVSINDCSLFPHEGCR